MQPMLSFPLLSRRDLNLPLLLSLPLLLPHLDLDPVLVLGWSLRWLLDLEGQG